MSDSEQGKPIEPDGSGVTRPEALLAAIGEVAVCWADLEYRINAAIWALASMTDQDGACLTSQIPSFISRMRALIALVRENDGSEKLVEDLNSFARDTDELSRQRNRIIHDPWFIKRDTGEPARLQITADRRLIFEPKPATVGAVLKVAADIRSANADFLSLRKRISSDLAEKVRALVEESHGKGAAPE